MLSFFILIIGLLSEYQIFSNFWEEKIMSRQHLKFFFIIYFIFSVLITMIFLKKPFLVWFLIVTANLLSFFVPFIIQKRRKNDFQRKTVAILDRIISIVKSGRSFRDTIMHLQERQEMASYYFSEIFQAIVLEESPNRISSDAHVQRFYLELKLIAKSQHRITERLVTFRRTLKTEAWFAQKTQQALMQSRAQSMIMTILYFVLFAFVVWSGHFMGNIDLIFISVLLYFVGTIWVWKMGRSYKWKS